MRARVSGSGRSAAAAAAAAASKSLQSCSTLCDPIDGSPLGSSVPGILQAASRESSLLFRLERGPGIALQAIQEKKALSSRAFFFLDVRTVSFFWNNLK